jgi:hypothetical protein
VLLVAPSIPTSTCLPCYVPAGRPAGHRVHVPWARRALDGDGRRETNTVSVVGAYRVRDP